MLYNVICSTNSDILFYDKSTNTGEENNSIPLVVDLAKGKIGSAYKTIKNKTKRRLHL